MAKIPVVFTFDKRIVLGAAVAIKSLVDSANPETSYDIYVYHPDIDDKTVKEFEKMLEGTNHSITFEFISKDKFKNAPINKNGSWTEIVYYRLLIPELLPQYDKVIYSDVDVFFKEDLSEVYNIDMSDFEWGGVRAEINCSDAIGHKYFPENKNEFIFWSGFMLINCKKMREEHFFDKCLDTINTFKTRLKFFDLDTINITSEKIYPLPFKYCTLESIYAFSKLSDSKDYKFLKHIYADEELSNAKQTPAIIHYAGELGKPWRRKNIPDYYKEYMDKKIPKSLRRFTFRDFRKRLFSKV